MVKLPASVVLRIIILRYQPFTWCSGESYPTIQNPISCSFDNAMFESVQSTGMIVGLMFEPSFDQQANEQAKTCNSKLGFAEKGGRTTYIWLQSSRRTAIMYSSIMISMQIYNNAPTRSEMITTDTSCVGKLLFITLHKYHQQREKTSTSKGY